MRVLSLGAGVQSTTLLLMAVEGEIQIERAIFADTGWEPHAVYKHLTWLRDISERAGIPVDTVRNGHIREITLDPTASHAPTPPLFILNPDGTKGRLRRQCTEDYKIIPIRRRMRQLGAHHKNPFDMVIGISWDESQRMRDATIKYYRHVYPLVERRMTRDDCLQWLVSHGYPEPSKSACIGCPFRSPTEWKNLTAVEWQDAVDFDNALRTPEHAPKRLKGQAFLHRSCVPLQDVIFPIDAEPEDVNDGCGVLCAADEEGLVA